MMNYANTLDALQQYHMVDVHSGIESASPHKLIQMLMDGASAKIGESIACLKRGDIAGKGGAISHAIARISGLRGSLDYEAGGEIAANLGSLYDYMERRLVESNINNDVGGLEEVQKLLSSIRTAWDQIPATADGNAA